MTLRFTVPSSVIRWLLMVVGCVVLEAAQPMMAQAVAAPVDEPAVSPLIFPAGEGVDRAHRSDSALPGSAGSWVFALVVGSAGGGWWWWQRRRLRRLGSGRNDTLRVEQSRPLGNRQFLVVAACDGRRLLLGVAPGQINLLCDLDLTNVSAGKGNP